VGFHHRPGKREKNGARREEPPKEFSQSPSPSHLNLNPQREPFRVRVEVAEKVSFYSQPFTFLCSVLGRSKIRQHLFKWECDTNIWVERESELERESCDFLRHLAAFRSFVAAGRDTHTHEFGEGREERRERMNESPHGQRRRDGGMGMTVFLLVNSAYVLPAANGMEVENSLFPPQLS